MNIPLTQSITFCDQTPKIAFDTRKSCNNVSIVATMI